MRHDVATKASRQFPHPVETALAIEAVSFCEAKDTSGERGRCEAVKIISKKNCRNLINN